MRFCAPRCVVGAALPIALLIPCSASSQRQPLPGSTQPAIPSSPALYDTSAFAALRWREIGPFRGGRSVAVAGSSKRPNEYYFGTTGGGVFKTTDGGITWVGVTDKYFGGTIGAIGISESNPDIVYVGAGEYPIRGNVSHGDGVWRTSDGGKTWASLGLSDTRQISRVRVHPTNPDIVYVGAQGHVFGPNSERGVYKTTDGGKSWRKVLYRNDSTGITDLVLDPNKPETIYAAFWQAWRTPWQLVSGGAGSGIFKSTDGGEHWTEITRNPGMPQGVLGNIGLAVSPTNSNKVWAIVEADSGGVYRSTDGGASWSRTNSDRRLRQRAWYYTRIFADPKDEKSIYVLNTGMYRSSDDGKTFRSIQVPHGDNHDLWIAPNDAQRMIESNDGGANVSFNGGRSWTEQDQATAQFYHVTTTNHFPYRICGAQQDNSTLCGPSRKSGGIAISDWYDVGGGESGYIAVRPDTPDIAFAGSYGGFLTRKDIKTGFERDVNPWPNNPMGHDAADAKYRFQWTFPIVISPHNPSRMYVGSSVIFQTDNEGQTFKPISPDLTRHDPRTLGGSGGPITKDQTSVEYYGTVFTIAESPRTAGVIWAGSDDGLVHITRDGGKTWKNVTPAGLPEWARISMIEPSNFGTGTAYIAANRYQLDDMRPYLYKTNDYGASWTPITRGIPATEFTRVLREDPERAGLLYAGTERGVWVSFDDGANWQSLRQNLPIVPIHDLAVKEGDLIAATHGRSFWILDDLSSLRQLSPEIPRTAAHLFKSRKVYRAAFGGGGGTGAAGGHPNGANPPAGGVIYYWLAQPRQVVTMDFLDRQGKVIRTFTSQQDPTVAVDSIRGDSIRTARNDSLRRAGLAPDTVIRAEARGEETPPGEEGPPRRPPPPRVANKAGLNMFAWNLRYSDASVFENMILWAGGTSGPVALPGTYSVRMNVNGQHYTQPLVIVKDPRSTASDADLREQFDFLMRIRDRTSQANDAVKTIRSVKTQVADREKRMPADKRAAFSSAVNALTTKLSAVEGEIYQVRNQSGQDPLNYPIRLNNKIAALSGVVGGMAGKPTSQSYTVFNDLSSQLDRQLQAIRGALLVLPSINATLRDAGLPSIVPSADEIKTVPPRASSTRASDDEEVDK
ncbi:MAG: glycosyl hydrolase [Gemmatimonadota bacterium]|nr:glycosyl hydrolase [Gemmatimonadota bacterium]